MTEWTARPEGYWESLGEDEETVLDVIRTEAPEWDILAVDLADRNEDVLFLLVVRRRVSDAGNLILSERYFRFDLSRRRGSFTQNGIERRVTGSLGAALRVLYAATTNGDTDPDDPMLMDSREDGLQYHPGELSEPVTELIDREESETVDVRDLEEPERDGWVSCRRCDESVHIDNAVQFGQGDLGDFWIHKEGCPEEGDDDE